MVSVTAFFAGLLGLLFIVLSGLVIVQRYKLQLPLGDGGNRDIQYRIRAHANFAEYVPLALVIMGLAEMQGSSKYFIAALGMLLLLGRISHAYGLVFAETANPPKIYFRSAGMMMTFTVLTLASLSAMF